MGDDDLWNALPHASSGTDNPDAGPALLVEKIEGFKPLDAQFGAVEPMFIPPQLRDVLFGEPEGSKAKTASPLRVYAILDAAKVPGLPEMLEAAFLESDCLFQGQSEEDIGDVSPWLVKLSPSAPLTRNLFTSGDAPWHLWDRAPVIVVGSKADMTAVRRHIRRFTSVQDRRGKWFMFRFWEADYLLAYLMALTTTKQAEFMGPMRIIVTTGPDLRIVRWGEGS
ncbi:MAG: hypothetical protein DI498_09430 [Paracoccus denitrificans]|nr:MAG: hypothetical protein DI498_09430 [Paracoccus denitrificans]PZO84089.1 MAG: hypothetical protein DI633_09430 [Paracoccus denitrificans]